MKKKQLFTCFVDIRKAFDSVDHNLLWHKLCHLGISQRFLNVLKSMYFKAKSCVRIGNSVCTSYFPCQKGVRQGCPLSPILFNLFMCGLDAELQKNNAGVTLHSISIDLLMYADDIVLFSSNSEGLNRQLNTLDHFCRLIKLEVNTNKSKVCIFGSTIQRPFNAHISGITLGIVKEYKYLGIWFSNKGTHVKAQDYVAEQCKRGLFALQSVLAQMKYPPITIAIKLWEALIIPIMCYGSEIWGFRQCNKMELIEKRFMKYILHLPSHASTTAVQGEIGQLPMHLWQTERILKYWGRLCSWDLPVYLKDAVKCSISIANKEPVGKRRFWWSRVEAIFIKAGYFEFFHLQSCSSENINMVMNRLADQFRQQWWNDLQRPTGKRGDTGNKLRTYALFKSSFLLEDYLTQVNITKHRIALTRLRTSCHCLQIERGRYKHPPQPSSERLCTECNMLEDEIHFLCVCKKHEYFRGKLFQLVQERNKEFIGMSAKDKFVYMMSSKCPVILQSLAQFVYKGLSSHAVSL